jgi:hypothetical protein
VPQGSVIAPLLFILFVNGLPEWISTNIRMFADDTKLWCKIGSVADSQGLQNDLDSLAEWSRTWLLRFNSAKCKVMHIGHNFKTRYYIEDENGKMELQEVKEEKDLGVYVTNNLKNETQCQKAAAKARRVIGMIRRSFRRLDSKDFCLIYKTYIRPHLECCIQAWSPHLTKDIKCLEQVQRAATRLVPAIRKNSYETRLVKLGLTTLERRRARGDLIEVYKILTGKERVESRQFFQLAENLKGLRGHSWKLTNERS